jgi:hypothetical protein
MICRPEAPTTPTTFTAATYLEFVQDGRLARRVETHHEYSVLLVAKEQTVKAVIHGGEGTTHLVVVCCCCTVLSAAGGLLSQWNGHYRDRSRQLFGHLADVGLCSFVYRRDEDRSLVSCVL